MIRQGELLKVDGIKYPVLVVSKDYFNQLGGVIGCPVYKEGSEGAIHIRICTDLVEGVVYCEKMSLMDMKTRHFSVIDRINLADIIDITDAIQSIFDYV